ncbi:MAG TPA: hypothetical protein VGR20_02365 [Acidimicrobiia bacterium]|jgi:hypothetical protein|nr:hypothetical protein [Acidimicrobiia bacterium]
MTPPVQALGSGRGTGNGRGGAPGQERATPPFCIERLLEGTLLTHQRSICEGVLEPGNQGE